VFELGQLLRKARLEKNITLESLQETTKIRKRYLEAIEDGNFKVLPGSFYVRAFIKSYAEAVGLDPAEVLEMYGNTIPQPAQAATTEPVVKRRSANFKVADRWNRWVTRAMVWSFLLLILGIIYYVISSGTKTDNSRNVSENQDHRLTDRMQSQVQGSSSSLQELKVTQTPTPTPPPTPTPTPQPEVKLIRSENGTDYYQIAKSDQLKVELSIIGDKCWIQIDKIVGNADNRKREMIEQGTLTNGNAKSWDVSGPVYLTLGAANAVELKVNGTIIPVGDSANVRRFQFDMPNT
jgi:cytoskeletal protein RodZ